jgi:hypothetical protein
MVDQNLSSSEVISFATSSEANIFLFQNPNVTQVTYICI